MERLLVLLLALVALASAQLNEGVVDAYEIQAITIATPSDTEDTVVQVDSSFIGGQRLVQATYVSGEALRIQCSVFSNPGVFAMSSDTGFVGNCRAAYSAVGGGLFDPPEDFVQFGGDCWLVRVDLADNQNTIFITTRTPVGLREASTTEAFGIQGPGRDICIPFSGELEEYRNVTSFEFSARGSGLSVDLQVSLICFASRVSCWHEFNFPGPNDPPQTGDTVEVTLNCINFAFNATTINIDFPFPAASGDIVDSSAMCNGGNTASVVSNSLRANDVTLSRNEQVTCTFDVTLTGLGNTGDITASIFNQDSNATSLSHGFGNRIGTDAICRNGVPSNFTIVEPFCPDFAFEPELVTANYRLLNHPDGVESPPPYCLRMDHLLHDGAVTPPGAVLFDCDTGSGLVVGISGMQNAVRISGSIVGGEKDPDTGVINNPSLLTVDITFRDFVPSNGGIATNDSQAIGTVMFGGETWYIRGKSGPPVLEIFPRVGGGITLAGWLEFSRNIFGPYTAVSVNDFLGLVGECINTTVVIPDRVPVPPEPTMAVPTGPPTIAPTATPTTRSPAATSSCPVRSCSDCTCSMCSPCANAACSRCDFNSPTCTIISSDTTSNIQIGASGCLVIQDSVTLRGNIMGTDGDDCISIGTGAIITGTITTGDGEDCVQATNAVLFQGAIRTGDGDDCVDISSALELPSIDTAEGEDCIEIRSSMDRTTSLLSGTGDDCVRITGGFLGDINTSSGNDCVNLMTTQVADVNTDVGQDCLVIGLSTANDVNTGDSDTGDTVCAMLSTLSGTLSTGNTAGENCIIAQTTVLTSFEGGAGADIVQFSSGSNVRNDISLGDGPDYLSFNSASQANTLSGGNGDDTIITVGATFNSVVGNNGNDCLESRMATGRISGGNVNVNGGADIDLCVVDATANLFDCE